MHAAYGWLSRQTGGQVVVAGTSSGGGLALALLLRLRRLGEPPPAGVLALSPWTDLTCSGCSYESLAAHGPSREYLSFWGARYLDGADPKAPEASPLFGDWRGVDVPMLLQCGGHEAMLDDSVLFAARAVHCGCSVTLDVLREQQHGFQHEAAFNDAAAVAVERAAAYAAEWLMHSAMKASVQAHGRAPPPREEAAGA